VVLSRLTIAGGKVSGSIAPANSGGGIYNNHGTLTVSNSVLQGNAASNGGAICNDVSVSVSATLRLSNSTITNNTATRGGGAIFNNGSGGGSAPLSISKCEFIGNSANNGGAILNDGHAGGSATITALSNSVLNANTASGNGGAIYNNGTTGGSATLVISYTTLSANTAINGGAINNDGGGAGSATQALTYSTLSANTASANGGAINNDGRTGSATLAVGTSTFYGNTAVYKGGAIRNIGTGAGGSATAEIDNSTVKANAAAKNSGAIDSDGTAGSATLAIGSTILDNAPTANIFILVVNAETTFTSKNHNLSSDAAGGDGTSAPGGYLNAGNDIRNTDPKFDSGGLRNNGGPTFTIGLRTSSPAIDKGLSSFPSDQRGYGFLGLADIGAFEFDGIPPVLFRVDALIKKYSQPDTAYATDNLYQLIPHSGQIEMQNVVSGVTATYQVKVENDSTVTRTFGVQAVETDGAGWSVTYRSGGVSITPAMRSGAGYTTATLAPGESEIITLRMTSDGTVAAGASKSATIRVFRGGADQTTRDAVKATTNIVDSTTTL
jgi:hypothetical protein